MSIKTTYRVKPTDGAHETLSKDFQTLPLAERHAKDLQSENDWQTIEIFKVTTVTEITEELIQQLPGTLPASVTLPTGHREISLEQARDILSQCKYWKLSQDKLHPDQWPICQYSSSFQRELCLTVPSTRIERVYTESGNVFFVNNSPERQYIGILSKVSDTQGSIHYYHPHIYLS